MKKSSLSLRLMTGFCLGLLSLFAAPTYAASAASGVQVCGGNHMQRTTQNEDHTTGYTLRNFNVGETILITRIIIVDGNGVFLFDGLPGGTFKSTLAPFQSTQFNTNAVLSSFLASADRPIQTYVLWLTSSGKPAERLGAGFVHRVRDSSTGKEIARHSSGCRDLY